MLRGKTMVRPGMTRAAVVRVDLYRFGPLDLYTHLDAPNSSWSLNTLGISGSGPLLRRVRPLLRRVHERLGDVLVPFSLLKSKKVPALHFHEHVALAE